MAKLKLLNTIFSKLGSLSKNDGQIVVARDSKSLYVDLEGERIEITDWVDIDTEESLLAILSPLINKYYYTKDTNKIWRYIGGEWKCLNDSAGDLAPSYVESPVLLKLSSGEKLSVAFGKISKAITDLISHIGDSIKHITSTERDNWNAAKTHADSTHAPTNAQENVIETVKVNGTALTPSSKAVNITIPTVGNGTITIKQAGSNKGTFTMNQSGDTTIELTDNNTTYGVATSSALGLVKSGTNITVDSSGNVSVNDDSHNHVISNVDGLQDALDGKSATGHTHDDRYYTEAEVNSLLLSKQDSSTAITTSNIASQSVNYAKRANYADGAGMAVDQTARNAAETAQNTANSKVGTISSSTWYNVTAIATFTDSNNAILSGGKGNYIFGISAWSDKRLKKNIKNSSLSALDKINKVQYREFDFVDEKFGTHQDIGYVADELKEVFPECVISVPQDKEKCGYEELYQVQDTSMIKYLGKAIQELYSIIESQQKEIDELKKRINAN